MDNILGFNLSTWAERDAVVIKLFCRPSIFLSIVSVWPHNTMITFFNLFRCTTITSDPTVIPFNLNMSKSLSSPSVPIIATCDRAFCP